MKKIMLNSYEQMSGAAAKIIADAIREKPDLVLGLPTGSTPIGMYDKLAQMFKKGEVDFSRVKTFNLDEYEGLLPSNEQSYYHFMNKHLYSRVNLKPENTHLPKGAAKDLNAAAKEYDALIEKNGGIDLFIVGIGQNGHIGFNEPASSMPAFTHVVKLTESTIKANSRLFNDISEVPKYAVTMGMATIMRAKKIILLSSGESKKEAIEKTLGGVLTLNCPSTLLNLHRDITLLIC